jgi:phosphate-selective porin OprO and OprP
MKPRLLSRLRPFPGAIGYRSLILVPLLLTAVDAMSQDDSSRFDELWSHTEVLSGTSTSAVRSVALTGRFQVDQTNVDDGNDRFSDVDLRRLRFGVKVKFGAGLTLHTEADFDPSGGNLGYKHLTDAYLAFSPGEAFELAVGKQSAAFTMDGQTSSKELLTIDRSNLTNNIWFTDEYIPGISVSGKKSGFVYDVGVFASGHKNRGFGHPNGHEFVLMTIGRDLSEHFTGADALLRFNYVDNDPDPVDSFTRPLENVYSLNFSFEKAGWGVRSDVSSAKGALGQSDLAGFMVMPFLNLKNDLQLVTRYTYLDSSAPNGVRFARYESAVVSGRGDRYSEVYVGLNHYWYGHKLKIQTGLTYADMNDSAADGGAYSGWSWTSGFRLSW